MQLNLNHVSYTYPGAAHFAVHEVTAVFPQGWTGIVGDNGCGKSTLAATACGMLVPDMGAVSPALFAVYCQQDSSVAPTYLEDFACDWGGEAQALRRTLRIEDDWLWRFDSLSGGQQKRVQVACALWQQPDVLVMDEPTNDLDAPTRTLVRDALAVFRGIGLLISHDRELLDELVAQCLMFEGGRFVMRPGSYAQASGQAQLERESMARAREKAQREKKRIAAEAARRRAEADKAQAKRSARGLDKHDSDARAKIGLAIVSGKDGVAAKLSASMDARLAKADAALQNIKTEKRYAGRFCAHGEAATVKTLVHLEAGEMRAGEFVLHVPELWMGPVDHIVLTGNNGCGKSLLVRALMQNVAGGVKVACVPQEVSADERAAALCALDELDQAERGRVLAIVGGLNSDPERLADGHDVSPGELKKLLLAQQLIHDPHLLVLDEPTNHLDMGSVDALAGLLAEFPGAFLLVTHDAQLAVGLDAISWRVREEEPGSCALVVG